MMIIIVQPNPYDLEYLRVTIVLNSDDYNIFTCSKVVINDTEIITLSSFKRAYDRVYLDNVKKVIMAETDKEAIFEAYVYV